MAQDVTILERVQRDHGDAQRDGAILVWGQAELGLCSLERILGTPHLKGFWKGGRETRYMDR